MKKTLLSALLFIVSLPMLAQLNVQLHYDFGDAFYGDKLSNRPHLTATVENFTALKEVVTLICTTAGIKEREYTCNKQ